MRLRLLRPPRPGAEGVFGVSTIIDTKQSTRTYYDEHEAQARFVQLVDEIPHEGEAS